MLAPFRARASVGVGPGLHPTLLLVTHRKPMSRVGCRKPALAHPRSRRFSGRYGIEIVSRVKMSMAILPIR
jgi:hypothetical protein